MIEEFLGMPCIMVLPNFKLSENLEVYPPREDTWFLADTLETLFRQELFTHPRSLYVCEIGVGTGFISIVLAKKFPQIQFVGTDISPQSAISCHMNMSDWLQMDQFDIFCMDLLSGFNPLKFNPDIVFFNPPYVRTSQKELKGSFLEKTWAGGPNGLGVIRKLLDDLSRFSFGKAFFLSSAYNENESLETDYCRIFHFKAVAERKIEDEKLLCYEVKLKRT